jgi:phenylacetate-CoA ligase
VEFGSDKVIDEPHRVGELVLTSLANEAMPIFRLRTGHAVLRIDDECKCGRTMMRVAEPTEYEGTVSN